MTITWDGYDAFSWAEARQSPMVAAERADTAELVADVLELAAADRQRVWGDASAPGRYAATVVRLCPDLAHKYKAAADRAGISEIGVKVFKAGADAAREARKLIPFHLTGVSRLPGIPNPNVQRSLDAGYRADKRAVPRGYIIQEWVPGPSLEAWLIAARAGAPVEARRVPSILRQLFLHVIIPLWQQGTIWWDIRDANFCYCETRDVLKMIDVDSLAAYADEILSTGSSWQGREKGRATALARLRQMTIRLLSAQCTLPKGRIEAGVKAAWAATLEPELRLLGRTPPRDHAGGVAFANFMGALASSGLIEPT